MDVAQAMCVCKHVREPQDWLAPGSPVLAAHTKRWLEIPPAGTRGIRGAALAALWPALLRGSRLDALPEVGSVEATLGLDAILSTPFEEDGAHPRPPCPRFPPHSRWRGKDHVWAAGEGSFIANRSMAQKEALEATRERSPPPIPSCAQSEPDPPSAVVSRRVLKAIRVAAGSAEHLAAPGCIATSLLPWLLSLVPAEVPGHVLSETLKDAPAGVRESTAVASAIAARGATSESAVSKGWARMLHFLRSE